MTTFHRQEYDNRAKTIEKNYEYLDSDIIMFYWACNYAKRRGLWKTR